MTETALRKKRKAQMFYDPELIASRLMEVIGGPGDHGGKKLYDDGLISASSIGSYRRGEFAPSARNLQMICSYFNVSADYILGLSSIKEIPKKWIFSEGMWRCPHCGEAGEPNFNFCPNSGRQENTS